MILPFYLLSFSIKNLTLQLGQPDFLVSINKIIGVEIGHTWIAESFRRTTVNTELKFLMLQYVFEKVNCIAVEIRTDVLNQVSRNAIERYKSIS
ncbi:MAG: GNAT family N-acetyltransferase [Nitrosopumilus sp.]|nr:GNAT family N-acetyltransferase [Nitrosopumilus sp.]